MSDGDETSHLGAEIDKTLAEQAREKAEYGQIKQLIEEAADAFVHGTGTSERARLRTRREDLDDEMEQLREEIRVRERKLEKKQRQRDRVADRLDELTSIEGTYDEKIAQIEGKLYDGARITPDDRLVKDAAEIRGVDPQTVHAEIRERNPGVDEMWFRTKQGNEPARGNPISERMARGETSADDCGKQ